MNQDQEHYSAEQTILSKEPSLPLIDLVAAAEIHLFDSHRIFLQILPSDFEKVLNFG